MRKNAKSKKLVDVADVAIAPTTTPAPAAAPADETADVPVAVKATDNGWCVGLRLLPFCARLLLVAFFCLAYARSARQWFHVASLKASVCAGLTK